MNKYLTVFLLLIIVLFGFLLRYKAADHDYISQWDEAYHALVARNMMSHPLVPTLYDDPVRKYDYRNYGSNHIWVHKPPVTFWLMGSAMAIGGIRETVFRLPSVVLGTIAIFLTFFIAKTLFGSMAGYCAATLHAINPFFIRLISGTIPTDHVEVTVSFFVEAVFLVLVFAAKRSSLRLAVFAGALLGCGVLSKSWPAAIALAAAPFFWRGREHLMDFIKPLALVLLAAAAVVLPWQLYTSHTWPNEAAWESQQVIRHLFEVMEGHDHPAHWYIKLIPLYYGGMPEYKWTQFATLLVVMMSVVYALFCYIRNRDKNLFALLMWAFVPYVVFSLARTKLISYVSIAVPAVLIMMGFALASLFSYAKKVFSKQDGILPRAIAVLAVAALTLGYFMPMVKDRVSADYSVCPWNDLYDYPEFRDKMLAIGRTGGKKIILNVGDYKRIQAMFYTGSPAYPDVLSAQEIEVFIKKGYRPYILTDYIGRNAEKIRALQHGSFEGKDQLMLINIPEPKAFVRKHPYVN
jgi:4-amino-4-deoxy-L-arabinose transferase-like glycosyltransferase